MCWDLFCGPCNYLSTAAARQLENENEVRKLRVSGPAALMTLAHLLASCWAFFHAAPAGPSVLALARRRVPQLPTSIR